MKVLVGVVVLVLSLGWFNSRSNEQDTKKVYLALQKDYNALGERYRKLYQNQDASVSKDSCNEMARQCWALGVTQTINHIESNAAYPSDKWVEEMKKIVVGVDYETYKREYKKLEPKYDPDFKPQPLQLAADSVLR